MYFMISVIDVSTGSGTDDEMDAIDAFNDRLRAHGHWVIAGGLEPPHLAKVIDNRGETPVVIDGPVVKSREYVSGFWIIEAQDLDEALALATEGSKACHRKVEVRSFLR